MAKIGNDFSEPPSRRVVFVAVAVLKQDIEQC
jgi:hypothetical protein